LIKYISLDNYRLYDKFSITEIQGTIMELRSCLRSPLKLPITLTSEHKEIHCVVRDFGMGGMFVEVENSDLVIGSDTEINFSLYQDNGEKNHLLHATIAHSSPEGLGLSFSQPNTGSFRTLQELVKYTKKQNLH